MVDILHFFRKKTSGQLAKDRLKILLISDRIHCTPETMELIKADIAKVISKYMLIDAKSMDVHITTSTTGKKDKTHILYANIPILDLKH